MNDNLLDRLVGWLERSYIAPLSPEEYKKNKKTMNEMLEADKDDEFMEVAMEMPHNYFGEMKTTLEVAVMKGKLTDDSERFMVEGLGLITTPHRFEADEELQQILLEYYKSKRQ